MPKFICVESNTEGGVPKGAILIGERINSTHFLIVRDAENVHPLFKRGLKLPFDGYLWKWELVKE